MKRHLYIILTFITFNSFSQRNLLKGYENFKEDSTSVVYEQRLYRNGFDGFAILRQELEDSSERLYIPTIQGVPFVGYKKTKNGQLQLSHLSEKTRLRTGVNRWFPLGSYKFDFWIQPQFIAQFGNFDNPVESKTNILLNTQIPIARGLMLNTGVVFPIVNDIDSQPKKIRLAPTYLNKFSALTSKDFLSASVGFFYSDQYGLNIQYRHADLSKRWSWGLEGGYTGYYRFVPGYLEYAKPSHALFLADVAFRTKNNDITLKLSGGQFMHNDRGARLDFIRQFAKVEIAFFGIMTGNGNTIGFNFAIPIPPGNIIQSNRVRLRTTDEFRWEYIYTRGYSIAEKPRLNYQLDERLRQYNLNYWRGLDKRLKVYK